MKDFDLKNGMLPISKAASSLARLLVKARASGAPIIVTQKGYPTGVILSLDAYLELFEYAGIGALVIRDREAREAANRGAVPGADDSSEAIECGYTDETNEGESA